MARKAPRRDAVPLLEWAAAGLGLLVLLVMLWVMAGEIVSGGDDDVPLLSVRVEAVTATPAGHVVQFRITNRSAQTAAAVQVEGKLSDEVATASVDYVPGRSEARGGLLFEGDPRTGAVELRVTGYELP
ncbi:MAG: hypothetical protein ACREB1_10345 [Sphingomicrobium sp.]